MARKYKDLTAGEWERPVHRGYRLRCCDCGKVHRVNFRIIDGGVEFQVFDDHRATAAIRRKRQKKN